MAPKRAAQSPKGRAGGRVAKVARTATSPKVDSKCAAVFELIDELSTGLPTSCVEMLTVTLPHALKTLEVERHSFQATLLANFGDLCSKEQTKREEQIAKAAAQVEAHASEHDGAAAKVEAASCVEQAARADKEASEASMASGNGAANAAAASLDGARKSAEDAEAGAESKVGEKADFDAKVDEFFLPLKSGEFTSKEWRQRQKAIGQLMALVGRSDAPDSLKVALPLALKETPDARGTFTAKVVDEAERLLKEHSAALKQAIATAKATAAERQEEVARAEALAKEAAEARDAAQESCIAKENEWLEAEEVLAGLRRQLAAFPEEGARLENEVEVAKASLEALRGAAAKFQLLVSPPPPQQPEAEEEPVAAAVAADERAQ
mmetsp:Transcript_174696/g.560271  ORF Transcript_174696/g.560271 Transcript_174696/m.560271 type:complete len:380 (-) Transcript_174696:45-1184(-)|eukprot:CAMPEP_0203872038 /NCGR_PEP_ID=MMETSP0359-20131031/19043_1 /ASSEMBLY_ACC=CAM_ASM_000338 /TAXON_ID=268821 /ORGANISM="Scrippsiella Hangoei, Strain SHTV-5" /LENGTH=379 /DNA_ID=CAMNT_0050790721 /DNA_START=55 /DNA_END=1194 /DNA_ORIENTATION=+